MNFVNSNMNTFDTNMKTFVGRRARNLFGWWQELLIGTEYNFMDFHEEWKAAAPK